MQGYPGSILYTVGTESEARKGHYKVKLFGEDLRIFQRMPA